MNELLKEMIEAREYSYDDQEFAHIEADDILIRVIHELLVNESREDVETVKRILTEYRKVNKWYA